MDQEFSQEKAAKHGLSLESFLQHDGDEFINAAYLEILGRRPDREGSKFYTEKLFSGRFGKIEILDALQRSAEGRKRGIAIPGLSRRARLRRLFRIPVLGYAARTLWLILSFPRVLRHLDAFETHARVQIHGLAGQIKAADRARADHVNRVAVETNAKIAAAAVKADRRFDTQDRRFDAQDRRFDTLDGRFDALNPRFDTLDRRFDALNPRFDTLDRKFDAYDSNFAAYVEKTNALEAAGLGWQDEARQALARGEARIGELIDGLDGLRAELVNGIDVQLAKYRANLLDQERRLTILLEEARRRLPAPLDPDQLAVFAAERDHMLDRLYLMIEDRFRGTRADIKSRQELYLPEARAAVAGSASLPIVDLGCGRGEWLELLREAGLLALGVDSNTTMIETCQALGLDVVASDALEFLRRSKPGAFSAISGFHIIEHMPFAHFIALIDEALRALKPGGLLIFETPNPSNMLVATHNFYMDPTHLKPLPSVLTAALLEARGFVRIEIRNLFPHPNLAHRYEPPVLNEFNQLFYGPQDYGAIAWKPPD